MPRRSYTAVFKLQVISYAEEHGNRAAGRKFDVDESNVRKWRRNKEDIKKMSSMKKARRVCAPDLALICKWIVHVWQELDPQIIVHSFVKCCISSALDGSQEDVVWKDDITDS